MTSNLFSDIATHDTAVDDDQGGLVVDLFADDPEDLEPEPEPVVEPEPEPQEAAVPKTTVARPRAATRKKTDKRFTEKLEKFYSTEEVARRFFGKSTQWLYWGLRNKDPKGNPIDPVFLYEDGTPIIPMKVGKGQRARYTLPIIREMAYSCFRRGNLKEDELREVLSRIHEAEEDSLV